MSAIRPNLAAGGFAGPAAVAALAALSTRHSHSHPRSTALEASAPSQPKRSLPERAVSTSCSCVVRHVEELGDLCSSGEPYLRPVHSQRIGQATDLLLPHKHSLQGPLRRLKRSFCCRYRGQRSPQRHGRSLGETSSTHASKQKNGAEGDLLLHHIAQSVRKNFN